MLINSKIENSNCDIKKNKTTDSSNYNNQKEVLSFCNSSLNNNKLINDINKIIIDEDYKIKENSKELEKKIEFINKYYEKQRIEVNNKLNSIIKTIETKRQHYLDIIKISHNEHNKNIVEENDVIKINKVKIASIKAKFKTLIENFNYNKSCKNLNDSITSNSCLLLDKFYTNIVDDIKDFFKFNNEYNNLSINKNNKETPFAYFCYNNYDYFKEDIGCIKYYLSIKEVKSKYKNELDELFTTKTNFYKIVNNNNISNTNIDSNLGTSYLSNNLYTIQNKKRSVTPGLRTNKLFVNLSDNLNISASNTLNDNKYMCKNIKKNNNKDNNSNYINSSKDRVSQNNITNNTNIFNISSCSINNYYKNNNDYSRLSNNLNIFKDNMFNNKKNTNYSNNSNSFRCSVNNNYSKYNKNKKIINLNLDNDNSCNKNNDTSNNYTNLNLTNGNINNILNNSLLFIAKNASNNSYNMNNKSLNNILSYRSNTSSHNNFKNTNFNNNKTDNYICDKKVIDLNLEESCLKNTKNISKKIKKINVTNSMKKNNLNNKNLNYLMDLVNNSPINSTNTYNNQNKISNNIDIISNKCNQIENSSSSNNNNNNNKNTKYVVNYDKINLNKDITKDNSKIINNSYQSNNIKNNSDNIFVFSNNIKKCTNINNSLSSILNKDNLVKSLASDVYYDKSIYNSNIVKKNNVVTSSVINDNYLFNDNIQSTTSTKRLTTNSNYVIAGDSIINDDYSNKQEISFTENSSKKCIDKNYINSKSSNKESKELISSSINPDTNSNNEDLKVKISNLYSGKDHNINKNSCLFKEKINNENNKKVRNISVDKSKKYILNNFCNFQTNINNNKINTCINNLNYENNNTNKSSLNNILKNKLSNNSNLINKIFTSKINNKINLFNKINSKLKINKSLKTKETSKNPCENIGLKNSKDLLDLNTNNLCRNSNYKNTNLNNILIDSNEIYDKTRDVTKNIQGNMLIENLSYSNNNKEINNENNYTIECNKNTEKHNINNNNNNKVKDFKRKSKNNFVIIDDSKNIQTINSQEDITNCNKSSKQSDTKISNINDKVNSNNNIDKESNKTNNIFSNLEEKLFNYNNTHFTSKKSRKNKIFVKDKKSNISKKNKIYSSSSVNKCDSNLKISEGKNLISSCQNNASNKSKYSKTNKNNNINKNKISNKNLTNSNAFNVNNKNIVNIETNSCKIAVNKFNNNYKKNAKIISNNCKEKLESNSDKEEGNIQLNNLSF